MTKKDVSHILYHLILRRCGLTDYNIRKQQHTDLGAHFVASFFEQSDSETPTDHFHCLIRLPLCKKTYEDHYRERYEERNLQVLKQIKPATLDPTHLENTLLYISKDGHRVDDDKSINWTDYQSKRQLPVKDKKNKPTFNEFLCSEFSKELKINPDLYVHHNNTYGLGEQYYYERNVLKFIKNYFTSKYNDFDEMIIIRKFHLLNNMFSLGCVDVVDLAINKLFR